MDPDGQNARAISELHGWQAWSPDGTRLAVLQQLLNADGSLPGRANLYVMDTDGSGQRLLLERAAIGDDPAWRPTP